MHNAYLFYVLLAGNILKFADTWTLDHNLTNKNRT